MLPVSTMLRRHTDGRLRDAEPSINEANGKRGAERRQDWNAFIGSLFAQGYLADDSIQDFFEQNLGRVLLVLILTLVVLLGALHSFLGRSLRRSLPPHGTVFCTHNPRLCGYNRVMKALMYDFRVSRDVVKRPDGTHSVITPGRSASILQHADLAAHPGCVDNSPCCPHAGFNRLDICEMPVQLYYADERLSGDWKHFFAAQHQGLVTCPTPCKAS